MADSNKKTNKTPKLANWANLYIIGITRWKNAVFSVSSRSYFSCHVVYFALDFCILLHRYDTPTEIFKGNEHNIIEQTLAILLIFSGTGGTGPKSKYSLSWRLFSKWRIIPPCKTWRKGDLQRYYCIHHSIRRKKAFSSKNPILGFLRQT